MESEVPAQFVATYYRMLYADPDSTYKFYDQNAQIIRQTNSTRTVFIICLDPERSVLPFDTVQNSAAVLSYTSQSMVDGFVIYVYGNVINQRIPSNFIQQFVLQQRGLRWFVVHDSFYLFRDPAPQLKGAEAPGQRQQSRTQTSHQMPQRTSSTPEVYPQPASSPPPLQPQMSSVPFPRRNSRIDQYDPERSATIVNLNHSYDGDFILRSYHNIAPLTDHYFTHHVIYLQFATKEGLEQALAAHIQPWQVNTAHIERGIIRERQQGRGGYRR